MICSPSGVSDSRDASFIEYQINFDLYNAKRGITDFDPLSNDVARVELRLNYLQLPPLIEVISDVSPEFVAQAPGSDSMYMAASFQHAGGRRFDELDELAIVSAPVKLALIPSASEASRREEGERSIRLHLEDFMDRL